MVHLSNERRKSTRRWRRRILNVFVLRAKKLRSRRSVRKKKLLVWRKFDSRREIC